MKIKLAVLALAASLSFGLLFAQPVSAATSEECQNAEIPIDQFNCTLMEIDPVDADSEERVGGIIRSVLNILSYVIGVSAIIVIIVLSLRLVLSGGSAETIKEVRNGIIYALVGLALAGLAQAMVFFILDKI